MSEALGTCSGPALQEGPHEVDEGFGNNRKTRGPKGGAQKSLARMGLTDLGSWRTSEAGSARDHRNSVASKRAPGTKSRPNPSSARLIPAALFGDPHSDLRPIAQCHTHDRNTHRRSSWMRPATADRKTVERTRAVKAQAAKLRLDPLGDNASTWILAAEAQQTEALARVSRTLRAANPDKGQSAPRTQGDALDPAGPPRHV